MYIYIMPDDVSALTNASPLSFGFPLPYFLSFYGLNTVPIKTKIYMLYAKLCPSLKDGRFVEERVVQSTPTDSAVASSNKAEISPSETENSNLLSHANEALSDHHPSTSSFKGSSTSANNQALQSRSSRVIKVGFASRYFSSHSVGLLTERVIAELTEARYVAVARDKQGMGMEDGSSTPRSHSDEVSVTVFFIASMPSDNDLVQSRIVNASDKSIFLPSDLSVCSTVIRNAALDLLIYPEIGMDPVTYFLAHANLAKTQAVWFGHPDTSGLPSIDYFITSDTESNAVDARYTERRYKMEGLGSCYKDSFQPVYSQLRDNPRNHLLHRAKFIESLNIPRSAHLYLVGESIYKLHSDFDEVVSKILLQDKLAYLLILDSLNKASWQTLYVDRMTEKLQEGIRERIIFYVISKNEDLALSAMAASHVYLDPYPTSGK
jgi:predicted O-linked N-acetylglucosamine transferase (SPINDLY family)